MKKVALINIVRLALLAGVIGAFLPLNLQASGGSPMPHGGGGGSAGMPAAPAKTPEEIAIEHYNAGLKLRDKGVAFLKDAAQATSDKDRAKLEKKAQSEFGKAASQFKIATEKNAYFHEAWSDLGFALRKTGDYAGALQAYDKALTLSPSYTPAVEYRAEAYLGLDRLDDAKQAYVSLFGFDRGRADELLRAMKGWVDKRRTSPGLLTPDAVQEFSAWVTEREQLAGQTPSVSELQQRQW